MCPNCEESEETVKHFLGQCPATALLRGNTFYNHYMTSRDIFTRYSLTTITKFIRLTNRFSDPDNLDQSGVTSCCLCSGPLALLVSHPLSSLHLAALSSTLLSYFPSYLSPGAGRTSSLLSSCGPSGVQPLIKKRKKVL